MVTRVRGFGAPQMWCGPFSTCAHQDADAHSGVLVDCHAARDSHKAQCRPIRSSALLQTTCACGFLM
jgi:hypothetical protein